MSVAAEDLELLPNFSSTHAWATKAIALIVKKIESYIDEKEN